MKPSDAKGKTEANPASVSDRDALFALGQGQIGALGLLYDRYSGVVYDFVHRATSDVSDADDIVQATFLSAAKTVASYDGKQACRSWLVGIAGRILYRRRRGLSRWARALRELSMREADNYADPHQELSARDEVQRLSWALAKLSEPKRVVLLLAEAEEQSCEQIARALQVPVGTVWTRLHHARRELKRLLEHAGKP
ncbi:MAG TPA: RNA polymerase sigma factor [Polyangiaceae bacterium]